MASQTDSLKNLLSRDGAFRPPVPLPEGDEWKETLAEKRVLCVGAGGLGCEILKDLALSGFKDITVIDLDTIDLSNLNRQFLFRKKDIGASKSETAAKFVMSRVPGCKITAYNKPIQDFPVSFYNDFDIVIAGLDNVKARRWLNKTLADLCEFDDDGVLDPSTLIPLIDGGTEGFKGQARVFLPHLTSCFECSVSTIPPPTSFAVCTIANIPRLPEHCVAYAKQMQWKNLIYINSATDYKMFEPQHDGQKNPNDPVKLDSDNGEHMTWLFNRAQERAEQYKIEGVTYKLTMQVVKNIIPAIASTNALISAVCVNEALKLATYSSWTLNNYFMYMGHDGTYTRTFDYDKNPECLVCGKVPVKISVSRTITVADLIEALKAHPALQVKNPSVSTTSGVLFMRGALAKTYAKNLTKPLSELVKTDEEDLTVTDKGLGKFTVKLKLID